MSRSSPTSRPTGTVVLALVGTLLLAVGLGVLVTADDGLVRERTAVDGVPVTVLRPAGEGPFPQNLQKSH